MSEKNYKVGEAASIVYQAPNKQTGLTIVAEIYTEDGTKDIVNFPDVTLTERETTGVYVGTFTPDVVGEWVILVHDDSGGGQVVKRYSVGDYNLDSVGGGITTLQGDVTTIDGKIDSLSTAIGGLETPPMIS